MIDSELNIFYTLILAIIPMFIFGLIEINMFRKDYGIRWILLILWAAILFLYFLYNIWMGSN